MPIPASTGPQTKGIAVRPSLLRLGVLPRLVAAAAVIAAIWGLVVWGLS